ncbi:hypothetical protein ACFQ60_17720 [Streptomyces zhihengii]|uniref:Uncharacterized protein n=1 Tax=Streptomyces zhihengii TaxID=1818004 RepID=A0ABS2UW56_9ACTN|nr:hypothetical protein [Streptomyces zhihengii]MBM9621816.1 hypothetical protein [Streptomyces zhihengii]
MSFTVPTLTAAQFDGLACINCGADDTEQRPTGDRSPSGAQLFACTTPCTVVEQPAQSATVFVEHHLADGLPLLYGRKGGALRVTFDPAQISYESARELFTEARHLYPAARAVACTNIGHTVVTTLPADELPVRIEQHGERCTVMYDDARITGEQLLALMDKAVGL